MARGYATFRPDKNVWLLEGRNVAKRRIAAVMRSRELCERRAEQQEPRAIMQNRESACQQAGKASDFA